MAVQESSQGDAVRVRVDRLGAVATVVLDRPAAMNALDTAAKEQLLGAVREVAEDATVRCVVLRGTGRAFCVGQDLREHAEVLASGQLDRLWATVPEHYNPVAELLATMAKPVVAAVNGLAEEAEHMAATGSTADHAAAVPAFLTRQRPEFEGR